MVVSCPRYCYYLIAFRGLPGWFAEAVGAVLALSASFLIIFANAVRFWDVGPALAQSWAPVEQLYGYFVVCVGLRRARVGTILGLSWAVLGYVGTFWAMLATYWAHVEPS